MPRKNKILSRLLIPCVLVSLLGLFSFPSALADASGFRITDVEIIDSRALLVTLNEEMNPHLWDYLDQAPTFHARYFRINGQALPSGTRLYGLDDRKSFEILLGSGLTLGAGTTYSLSVDEDSYFNSRTSGQRQDVDTFWYSGEGEIRIDKTPVNFSASSVDAPVWGIESAKTDDRGSVLVTMTQRVTSGAPSRTNSTGNFTVSGFSANYIERVPGGNGRVFRVYFNGNLTANTAYTVSTNGMSGPYAGGNVSASFTSGANPFTVKIESAKAVKSDDGKKTEIWLNLDAAVYQVASGGGFAGLYETVVSGDVGQTLTRAQVLQMFSFSGVDTSKLGDIAGYFPDSRTIVIHNDNKSDMAIADGATVTLNADALKGYGSAQANNVAGAPVTVNKTYVSSAFAPGYDPDAADYLTMTRQSIVFRHHDYIFTPYNNNKIEVVTSNGNRFTEVSARSFQAHVIENKYIKATFLPEFGGRMLSLIYKPTGKDLLYLNEVGTPYGIGAGNFLLNWLMVWGGVFPTFFDAEHGKYWNSPFEYTVTETDECITITEWMTDDFSFGNGPGKFPNRNATNLKLTCKYTMYKDKPYVDMNVTIDNPTASSKSYEYWTCTTLAPGEDSNDGSAAMEIVSPVERIQGGYGWGSDNYLPNRSRFYNWTTDAIAYAQNLENRPQGDWWGVINQSNQSGVIRVGNNKETYGLKIWVWSYGNSFNTRPYSADGSSARPYIELWAGVTREFFSKTNIAANATKSWQETYLPTEGLYNVTNATKDGAAHVKFAQDGSTYTVSADIFSLDFGKPMTARLFSSSGAVIATENFVPDPLSAFTISASGIGAGQTVAVAVYPRRGGSPVLTAFGTQGQQFSPSPLPNINFNVPITAGTDVTGVVKSYNPNNPATLKLMQGGVEKYSAVIAAAPGFGQKEQPFTFTDVEAGDYTLVITKDAHTSFTVQTVTVGDTDLDLTQDSRDAVKVMTLLCGDINGDRMINDNDLIVLWQAANYNKNVEQAANPLCDLNGDGVINDNDLVILWLAVNYNKGPVVVA